MASDVLAKPPASIDVTEPCSDADLHATIEEQGFANTISSSGDRTPEPLTKALYWRAPKEELAKLTVRGILGQGGMSSVLLVDQPSLNREVAVKVPRSKAGAQTLLLEAKLNGLVEHPGVIPVYALISDEDGQPALVMRKVDAVSWRTLISDSGHPHWRRLDERSDQLEANVRVLLQVCNTLAYAHSRGVIHRDLKPENVLIGGFGEIFLADWGIATHLSDQKPGSLVGTAAYLAPEMARGGPVDERTDVFLVGATLYELINGRAPWTGNTIADALTMASMGTLRPVTDSAPRELAAICAKAMAMRPGDRYASILEVKDALARWLEHRGSLAICDETWRRVIELESATRRRSRKEVYRLLAECRFGFSLARREWKDNAVAERGLERAVLLAAEYEVSLGHADAARALLAEVKRPPEELSGAVDAMAESNRKAIDRLKTLLTSADPKQDQLRRTVFGVTMATALLGFIAASLIRPDWFSGRWSLVVSNLVYNGLVALLRLVVSLRKRPLTWLNRSALGAVTAMALGALPIRVVGALLDVSVAATLSFDLLAITVTTAVLGLVLHRGFFVAVPGTLATVAAITVVGRWPIEVYTLGLALSMATTALTIRFGRSVIVSSSDAEV